MEHRESDFQKRVAEARQALAEGRLVEYLSGSDAETVDRLGGVQDLAGQDASSKDSYPEGLKVYDSIDEMFDDMDRCTCKNAFVAESLTDESGSSSVAKQAPGDDHGAKVAERLPVPGNSSGTTRQPDRRELARKIVSRRQDAYADLMGEDAHTHNSRELCAEHTHSSGEDSDDAMGAADSADPEMARASKDDGEGLQTSLILQDTTIDLVGCARCHGDGHPGLTFRPLTHPFVVDPYEFTHWAPCPSNGEPIMLTVVGENEG